MLFTVTNINLTCNITIKYHKLSLQNTVFSYIWSVMQPTGNSRRFAFGYDIEMTCSLESWDWESWVPGGGHANASHLRFQIINPPQPEPDVKVTILDEQTVAITIPGNDVTENLSGREFECYVSNGVFNDCFIERDVQGFFLASKFEENISSSTQSSLY